MYITTHNHAKMTDFGNFRGLLYPHPWTDPGEIWYARVVEYTCRLRLRAEFYLDRFILTPLVGEKPSILPLFQLCHSAVAPPSVAETKLNAGAHLQTFPYPTTPRSFSYSNAFMAKWRSQTLSFKKRDGQTKNKQKKHQTFSSPGGARNPSPTKLGMVIEEVRTFLVPPNHVRLRRIVSPLGGAENLGYRAHP